MNDLEHVFPKGHIYYDRHEGQYYDRWTDLHVTLADVAAFGVA